MTLRSALLRLVGADSYGSMSEVYRELETKQLTQGEREVIADIFNTLVHHMATNKQTREH